METKICTYSEKGQRMQLLHIKRCNFDGFQLRYNRKIIAIFNHDQALTARLQFCHFVSFLCINRESPLSFLTI